MKNLESGHHTSPRRLLSRRLGFTLVELMVALGLAAMISISIMVISNTARNVYEETTRRVDVYNKFRFALLSIDSDFSRWTNTSNLEFYADGRGSTARRNEHWDEGEELPDTKDDRGPNVVDGGTLKDFDEFAYIVERHYQGEEPDGTWKVHDAYQAYFRTMTYIEGRTREANVEYMLLDPNDLDEFQNPRPPNRVPKGRMRDLMLYKIVRYHDFGFEELLRPAQNFPIKRVYVEVCSNITDFRLEYTVENRFDPRVEGGFRTPAEDFTEPVEAATRPKPVPGLDGAYKKTFGYGSVKLSMNYQRATAYRAIQGDRQQRADHRPVRFGFEQNPAIRFAELTPGDSIFCFTDSNRGGAAAGAAAGGGAALTNNFASNTYTVKTNLAGRLEFCEDLSSAEWPRDQTGVRYKAGFLPDAIRVSLRVVDEAKGEESKMLQRVVWVRQKAR